MKTCGMYISTTTKARHVILDFDTVLRILWQLSKHKYKYKTKDTRS